MKDEHFEIIMARLDRIEQLLDGVPGGRLSRETVDILCSPDPAERLRQINREKRKRPVRRAGKK